MSDPALAALGGASLRTNKLSNVEVHTPLLIVQRSTTFPAPAVTPVTIVVGEFGLAGVADPVITLHVPNVPAAAALAAIRKVPLSHWMISGPAAAALGAASTLIVRPALVPTQPAAEVMMTSTTSLFCKVVVVNVFNAVV